MDNYYVKEFRDNYKKINDLEIKNDEDIDEFKKYYELNWNYWFRIILL